MTLEEKIKIEIRKSGFITIDRFMEIALFDPDKGYYIKKNPIGRDSDFITSPEISILFGEILGLFIVNQIREKLKKHDIINLIELGAGKGTLLNDILNTIAKFPDIYQKIRCYILDINEVLVEIQKQTLIDHMDKLKWIGSLDDIGSNSPYIYIANEFFDALPIKQFQKINEGIEERVIKLDQNEEFFFENIVSDVPEIILNDNNEYEDKKIIEYSEASIKFMKKISRDIIEHKGFAVIIDYGYKDLTGGDSLQSIYKHKHNNIFANIGKADITSHVNFRMLYNTALRLGIKDLYLSNQSEFLKSMGIIQRVEILSTKMNEKQKIDLFSRVNRLINLNQMGDLFKFFIIENL